LTSPVRRALLSQALGAALAGGLILTVFPALPAQPLAAAGLQGLSAAAFSLLLRSPVWWLPIHLGFMPLAILALGLGLPSWVWLAGFALLLLTFWRTDRSRVPLYLSNRPTADALAALLPAAPVAVVDLGCGDGGLLRRLARARPDCRFVGYEHAPLPYAWARISCRQLPNIEIRYGDFWSQPLGDYGLVYAFLSPDPMPRLWDKARNRDEAGCLAGQQQLRGTWRSANENHRRRRRQANPAPLLRPGRLNTVPDRRSGTYRRDACSRPTFQACKAPSRSRGPRHKHGECLAFSAIEGGGHAQ
jgi:SAM-dependent methyltransferase